MKSLAQAYGSLKQHGELAEIEQKMGALAKRWPELAVNQA
jgi:hypothetical protein